MRSGEPTRSDLPQVLLDREPTCDGAEPDPCQDTGAGPPCRNPGDGEEIVEDREKRCVVKAEREEAAHGPRDGSLDEERTPDERVAGTHQLHHFDLLASCEDGDSDSDPR